MHRLSNGTQVASLPDAASVIGTPGYATSGNPATGLTSSTIDPDQWNMFQEELCGIVETTGLTLDKTNNTQLLQALRLLFGITGTVGAGANEWFRLSNGLIVQAGTGQIIANNKVAGAVQVAFPVAFPNAVLAVTGSATNPVYLAAPGDPSSGSGWPSFCAGAPVTTGFRAVVDTLNTQNDAAPVINQNVAFTYIAFGY